MKEPRELSSGDHTPDNEIEPLNLQSIVRRTKTMKDAGLTIQAGTNTAVSTVLAWPLVSGVANEALAGYDRPPYLDVGNYKPLPNTLSLVPVVKQGPASIGIKWDETNKQVTVDMYALIASGRIATAPDAHTFIPLSRKDTPDKPPILLLHLDAIAYQMVEHGKRQRKKKSDPPKAG